MTKRQHARLSAALKFHTESQWHTVTGLPICDGTQTLLRQQIIAEFDRTGTLPAVPHKEK